MPKARSLAASLCKRYTIAWPNAYVAMVIAGASSFGLISSLINSVCTALTHWHPFPVN